MLAAEFSKSNRELEDTETNYLYVPWSSAKVRFSEKLQIIDVQDCLSVVYESHGSAKAAQSKYFSSKLTKTEKALECETGKLTMKVKWSDAARVRVAVGVKFMQKFFDKICEMDRSADMASKLNVDTLTILDARRDIHSTIPPMEGRSSSSGKRQRSHSDAKIVTIYALIFVPTGRRVYTGRTADPDRRLVQHASRGSKCRLVRAAFRKHGRSNFTIEPILRCRAADADVNESYWIIQNSTLYPGGYNLRHGSMAGDEKGDCAIVPACTGVIPFRGFADEAEACSEAWADVASIAEHMEPSTSDASGLCNDLLRKVHPDVGGERTYRSTEVAAMLNQIKEAC